jgi:DNA-binding LytR/AlgR family response regulator
VDLIFLDIQLTDGLSFSIFDDLEIKTPIIFTTAYDQFAIKAFELNSISYLLKPIRKRDLENALAKYKSIQQANSLDLNNILDAIQNQDQAFKKRFLVQIGEKIHKIETHEIAYFFAKDKAVYLQTFNGRSRSIDFSLDKIENQLDPKNFFRINRSMIININAIDEMYAYSRSRVKINLLPKNGEINEAIVSIDKSGDFKKWLT